MIALFFQGQRTIYHEYPDTEQKKSLADSATTLVSCIQFYITNNH